MLTTPGANSPIRRGSRGRTYKRRGFTIIEVLVALVILVTLAAVMLPALSGRISPANSATLARNLQSINAAIMEYRENVGHFPKELLQLSIRPGGTSVLDACGATLSTTSISLWQGPYVGLTVRSTGVQSGDAVIGNTLARSPANTSNSTVMDGLLKLSVGNVTNPIANDLESTFDTGSDLNHGNVIWIPTTGSIGTLTFAIPIRGC